MANKRTLGPRTSFRVHKDSKPAGDSEPEFTAQPRSIPDDIVAAATDEGGLSVAPDELGSHFLSEAVQQGELMAREAAELEFALDRDPDVLDRPSTDLSAWATMVDAAVQRDEDANALREAAEAGADRLETEREAPTDSPPPGDMSLSDTSIRDVSLLDREGDALDEVVTPEIDLEETGRHARTTPRDALGEQVRGGSS